MSQAVAPWLPLWKPIVGGPIWAVGWGVGGTFHTISWLRVWGLPVVSMVTISLVAGVGPARISVMMAISIISLISLVTLNNAPVALENLKRQKEEHVCPAAFSSFLCGFVCEQEREGKKKENSQSIILQSGFLKPTNIKS